MDRNTSMLSDRELEIALLSAKGLRSADIAELLFLSRRTIDAHLSHIYAKIKVRNRVQLLRWLTDNADSFSGQQSAR